MKGLTDRDIKTSLLVVITSTQNGHSYLFIKAEYYTTKQEDNLIHFSSTKNEK